MKEFAGKVAVITGGAGGIGLALAHRAVAEKMKVVIGDLRPEALAEAEKALKAEGGEVLAMQVDVARYDQVEAMAKKTFETFGAAHLLCNNAGIFATGVTWEVPIETFQWAVNINLMGVVHGIHAFVPHMIEQGDECHVVNMSSGAGLATTMGHCMYASTKHAVVGLTECLWHDLTARDLTRIGVTLVMPGYIQTDVMNPLKVSTGAIKAGLEKRLDDPFNDNVESMMRDGVAEGMPVATAADLIFQAVIDNKLYLLPNFEINAEMAGQIGVGRATGKNSYAGEV